ncbi:putative RNA methyltransferase [Listeria aquatica]|uniref:putative RNA methyltransferase n=1 Tax=Listeria aquatica TaxID=1494960 RepID=UPI0031F4E44A
MKSKLEQSSELLETSAALLRCPICTSGVTFRAPRSLVCSQNHSFDLAKPGYLFLLRHAAKPTKYDQLLFEARKRFIMTGFFQETMEAVLAQVEALEKKELVLFDAGSGEGSHLSYLTEQLGKKVSLAFGFDLAKEGIRQAARDFSGITWGVADLANCPLQTGRVDVILNMLSPASYDEFSRLLSREGLLIKVIPEADYLQELRRFFYQDERQTYSNEAVANRFYEHFDVVYEKRITKQKTLQKDEQMDLLAMTPLGFQIPVEKKEAFLENGSDQITLDHRIIVGKKKAEA